MEPTTRPAKGPARPESLGLGTDRLERLGVPVVDTYLVHRDDPAVPIGTTSASHLVEAIDASGIRLTADELRWLESGDARAELEPGGRYGVGVAAAVPTRTIPVTRE